MVKNNLVKLLGISFIISLLTILFLWNGFLNTWQEKVFDKFFISKKPSADVVIFAIDNESISKIGQWPWQRSVFAKAIEKLQAAKVIGVDVNFSEAAKNSVEDAALRNAITVSKPPVVLPLQFNKVTQETTYPTAALKEVSLQGLVNVNVSDDGIARNVVNARNSMNSFGSVIAMQFKGELTVPPQMRIDYRGPSNTFLTLPVSDLLAGNVPERIYANKIVLIGATAPDLHDFFSTPFGLVSGIEINANIVATLLQQKFYTDFPLAAVICIILALNALAAFCIFRVKRFYLLLAVLVLMLVGINVFAAVLFSFYMIFPVLYADFGFLLTCTALIIFQYATESKEKRFIYQSFKKYMSAELIDELLQDPSKLKIGGERRKVSIIFCDIRGFTQIAESMKPEELVGIMNSYFEKMSDILIDAGGLIEKYIGDAIMAFWGAPIKNEKQAEDACRSALKMVAAMQELNTIFAGQKIPHTFSIGVGVNTGEVIVGNMGSAKRFNYGMVGDAVNFTSRLEGLNKAYGTNIIISEATYKEIQHIREFFVRDLDTIIVKGKKEPRHIFELCPQPLPKETLELFYAGKKYYEKGDWANAIEKFSLAAVNDAPSKAFLERCQELQKNPPAVWNGVFEFKSK